MNAGADHVNWLVANTPMSTRCDASPAAERISGCQATLIFASVAVEGGFDLDPPRVPLKQHPAEFELAPGDVGRTARAHGHLTPERAAAEDARDRAGSIGEFFAAD